MLKTKRKDLGLSVQYVVNELKKRNISISTKTLYGWENGHRQVNADEFLTLCEIYQVRTLNEIEIAYNDTPSPIQQIFDSLNKDGQDKLIEYGNDLAALPKYKKCDMAAQQNIG